MAAPEEPSLRNRPLRPRDAPGREEQERTSQLAFWLACAIGAAWAVNYQLWPGAFAIVLALHGGVGAVLDRVLPPLARRLSPRAPRAAVALAVFLALGAAPAALDHFSTVTLSMVARSALFVGTMVLGLALGLQIPRLGMGAAGAAALVAAGVAFVSAKPDVDQLPKAPVVVVEPLPGPMKRVAVVGIDGGDFRVIDPMIARGELPTLASLRARGIHGVLESIEPTYSPVVWSSIFSGKLPEKHGITGWHESHAANIKTARLWRLLESAGMRSVVSNVPGTWPPRSTTGAMVSGFPIPSPFEHLGEDNMLVGRVFSIGERDGFVPTTVWRSVPDGSFEAELPLGEVPVVARSRLRNGLMEWSRLRSLLPHAVVVAPLRMRPEANDGAREFEIGGWNGSLLSGAWSPWIRLKAGDHGVYVRGRRLGSGDLYLTPAFQDPRQPIYWFTDSQETLDRITRGGMYVVEGAGWRAADDPEVRDALYEHLEDVATQRFEATLRVLDGTSDWRLLAFVFTLTDRVSHAFWRFHEPGAYAPLPPEELAGSRTRVEDAYRWVDAHIAILLQRLPADTTIFVVSDHGFQAEPRSGHGTHRKEGIFLAAGPGIEPSATPMTLSVLDLTPTVLAGLGLPVGEDMDGAAQASVFHALGSVRRIGSYDVKSAEAQAPVVKSSAKIDKTTEEQLRGLGYIE